MLAAGSALLASPTSPAAGCSGSSLYVVAHADDSILFMNPDLQRDVASTRCTWTIVMTAGDAGRSASYWTSRERGAEAAYAQMAGVSDSWTERDAGVPGHPIPVATLTGNANVAIAFLRLPDGNRDGSGFATYGNASLEKLWTGGVSTLQTVDGTSSYSKSSLTATLAGFIDALNPDRIATQDFAGEFGEGDHSDHDAGALFARAAEAGDASPHTLDEYLGYPISQLAANLSPAEVEAKRATWYAYAPYDPFVCQTDASCQITGYAGWWEREYTRGLRFTGLSPSSGSAGASVSLGGSRFTGATDVRFNGAPASFTVDSDLRITAVVPPNASSGLVTVTTDAGVATSSTAFLVLPSPKRLTKAAYERLLARMVRVTTRSERAAESAAAKDLGRSVVSARLRAWSSSAHRAARLFSSIHPPLAAVGGNQRLARGELLLAHELVVLARLPPRELTLDGIQQRVRSSPAEWMVQRALGELGRAGYHVPPRK